MIDAVSNYVDHILFSHRAVSRRWNLNKHDWEFWEQNVCICLWAQRLQIGYWMGTITVPRFIEYYMNSHSKRLKYQKTLLFLNDYTRSYYAILRLKFVCGTFRTFYTFKVMHLFKRKKYIYMNSSLCLPHLISFDFPTKKINNINLKI